MFKLYDDVEYMTFVFDNDRKPNTVEKVKMAVSFLYRRMSWKLKDTAAVISGRKLADNKEYEGASRVSQKSVEEEPRRWIIEECVPACEILWSKNIYTFMCSDPLDKNAWIELEIECLSDENKAILEQIKCEYPCYQYHKGCLNIPVKGKGIKAQEELIRIAERFVMQDVPKKYATYDMDTIYMKCGCYKDIENPDYIPLELQLANFTLGDWDAELQDPIIRVLDRDKIVKSDDEYIYDIGAIKDADTGIIYVNEFHYNKHLRYLESLKTQKGLR